MLRFITCGSVDDGKSHADRAAAVRFEDDLRGPARRAGSDSKKVGTQGQEIDFALLVDGLAAEREQGITIDVAYRFFATEKRKFIVADCPGHEQYTRNMVTGASTADLAVILIDARKGVLVQTRRHSYLCHLLGIRNIVLAVNKMDLVDYDQATFDKIVADYAAFAEEIGIESFTAIPISRLQGRQHHHCALAQHAVVRRAEPDRPPRNAWKSGRRSPRRQAVPHAGAVGQPPQPRFPRLLRPDRQRARSSRATRCACCPRARPAR